MQTPEVALVEHVRAASRQMVRELGFMQSTLAATRYPPSAVHAILEIGARRSLAAAQLADFLGLEKSSVSRMVRKLVDAGELEEAAHGTDARVKTLTLTAQGQHTLAGIHAFGRQQVASALARLPTSEQQLVGQGLARYAEALEAQRLDTAVVVPSGPVHIVAGYQPGVIGRVTEMHARFYARSVGFGQFFESQVAAGLAEFAARLDKPCNGLWAALSAGQIVGSVAVDGEDLGKEIAHLRWFIVDDGVRGAGLGRRLLAEALAFCDRKSFAAVHLWTFQGLDAARRLYEDAGFLLQQERPGSQWGQEVVEQCFVRTRT